ncbi:MAG: UbiA family prenyltransferase, partial [Pseudomonadota bacterium]
IYAHQDREDDALIGVRSTARLFGAATGRWLAGFLIAAVLLVTAAAILALIDRPPLLLGLALFGAMGFGWHLVWQLMRLDVDDPERCLVLFRTNRDTGLILAGWWAAAAALGAAAA